MKMFKIVFIGLILSMPLLAIDESAISETMKGKIDSITQVLKQKNSDKESRDNRVVEIIDPVFDFRLMGKLSLGKRTWLSLSSQQKDAFVTLFDTRIKASYIKKIELYSDEEVIVKDIKKVKSRIHLLSYIVSKGEQNEVLYKFYKSKNDGWLIYDVDIIGVSLIQIYRAQFSDALQEGTYKTLLSKLDKISK